MPTQSFPTILVPGACGACGGDAPKGKWGRAYQYVMRIAAISGFSPLCEDCFESMPGTRSVVEVSEMDVQVVTQ